MPPLQPVVLRNQSELNVLDKQHCALSCSRRSNGKDGAETNTLAKQTGWHGLPAVR